MTDKVNQVTKSVFPMVPELAQKNDGSSQLGLETSEICWQQMPVQKGWCEGWCFAKANKQELPKKLPLVDNRNNETISITNLETGNLGELLTLSKSSFIPIYHHKTLNMTLNSIYPQENTLFFCVPNL